MVLELLLGRASGDLDRSKPTQELDLERAMSVSVAELLSLSLGRDIRNTYDLHEQVGPYAQFLFTELRSVIERLKTVNPSPVMVRGSTLSELVLSRTNSSMTNRSRLIQTMRQLRGTYHDVIAAEGGVWNRLAEGSDIDLLIGGDLDSFLDAIKQKCSQSVMLRERDEGEYIFKNSTVYLPSIASGNLARHLLGVSVTSQTLPNGIRHAEISLVALEEAESSSSAKDNHQTLLSIGVSQNAETLSTSLKADTRIGPLADTHNATVFGIFADDQIIISPESLKALVAPVQLGVAARQAIDRYLDVAPRIEELRPELILEVPEARDVLQTYDPLQLITLVLRYLRRAVTDAAIAELTPEGREQLDYNEKNFTGRVLFDCKTEYVRSNGEKSSDPVLLLDFFSSLGFQKLLRAYLESQATDSDAHAQYVAWCDEISSEMITLAFIAPNQIFHLIAALRFEWLFPNLYQALHPPGGSLSRFSLLYLTPLEEGYRELLAGHQQRSRTRGLSTSLLDENGRFPDLKKLHDPQDLYFYKRILLLMSVRLRGARTRQALESEPHVLRLLAHYVDPDPRSVMSPGHQEIKATWSNFLPNVNELLNSFETELGQPDWSKTLDVLAKVFRPL